MNRFWPRSLAGQMALLIGVALLLAQLASLGFLLVQRQQFSRAEIDTPAITRFVSTIADFSQADPAFKALVLSDDSRRGARYSLAAAPAVSANLDGRSDTEARLRQALASASVAVTDVRAALVNPTKSPVQSHRHHSQQLLLSARLADGRWLNGELSVPAPPPLLTPQLGIFALLVYLFVLAATILIAIRIARPLRRLTQAADDFRGRNEPIQVEPTGPADLKNAILAFNAMNERLVKLLEEKDRTLGAIGHDLRTPLASLRIRAESVEPEDEREAMIRTIEEMTATLEDILVLARSGRSREPAKTEDVTRLVEEVAAEYCRAGQPVTFAADGAHMHDIHPNLLRRAVRNLIDNALKYAGSAEVQVKGAESGIRIAVLDRGPGLPTVELSRATDAFYRGEPSRNRATGGAGLGLAIATGVAESHGGTLQLESREGGGLAAIIDLPDAS